MKKLANEDVKKCEPMVEAIVKSFAKRVPSHIDVDDIRGEAYIGLMEAAAKFDFSRGWKFNTFAEHRVRGAILDYLRALDWVPRLTRERMGELERAFAAASREANGEPEPEDVAAAANMDLETYYSAVAALQHREVASLDSAWTADDLAIADVIADPRAVNPEQEAGNRLFLSRAFERLSDAERAVIEGCDLGGATLKKVAAGLGLHESRACQLRKSARAKIRAAA